MYVKVGNEIYNSSDVPMMIIINEGEKEQIANMPGTMYAQFPDDWGTEEEMREWMNYDRANNQ